MDLEKIANSIELEYLKILSIFLKSGQINVDKARETTQEFLLLLPFKDFDDIKTKINQFLVKNKEFKDLQIILLRKIEESKTTNILERMRSLMKSNKIDEALNLAST